MSGLTKDQENAILSMFDAPCLTVSGLIEELEKIERDHGGDLPVRLDDDSECREACAYDADGNTRGTRVEVILHGMP